MKAIIIKVFLSFLCFVFSFQPLFTNITFAETTHQSFEFEEVGGELNEDIVWDQNKRLTEDLFINSKLIIDHAIIDSNGFQIINNYELHINGNVTFIGIEEGNLEDVILSNDSSISFISYDEFTSLDLLTEDELEIDSTENNISTAEEVVDEIIEEEETEESDKIEETEQLEEENGLVLREGDRNDAVIQLKLDLEKVGFKVSNNPTNWYGPVTTLAVVEFQETHNLEVDGVADEETFKKIAEILASELQEEARNPDVIQLKLDLEKVGFKISSNPTEWYGPVTTRTVMEFQRVHGLPENGIADDLTLKKIAEILASDLQEGARNTDVIQLKLDLEKVGFKMSNNPTEWYGPVTTRTVMDFQSTFDIPVNGISDQLTLNKIKEVSSLVLREGVRHEAVVLLKINLEKVGFRISANPTTWYGPSTAKAVRDFQRAHNLTVNGVADQTVLNKINEILASPLQQDVRSNQVIRLKRDFDRAGFSVSANPTNLYGRITAQRVSQFQKYYSIPVNGIADQLTLSTLDKALNGEIRPKISSVVNGRQIYTYEQMEKDIVQLNRMYPDIIETRIIGKSVDGRNLHAIKLGLGKTEIFINGSNHAREHMTTNVTMKMLDDYARAYAQRTKIDGYDARQILTNTSIWFVPMVNPDGVTLVQKGHKSAKNPQAVLRLNNNSTNFRSWKANIRGVDLNRQFPALWNSITNNPGKPGPENYKGTKPLSEPEAIALYNFTLSRDFKTAISYHSSGEVIFTRLDQEPFTRNIASMVSQKTGYRIIDLKNSVSGGGFTDWFILTQKKPALTPEISPFVGARPVPLSNWNTIWNQNNSVGLMLANEAYVNRNRR
ncbi:hypothetical protein BKP45_06790 [Anaerobacillus alkalidiazotrophicus]|uniref:Peptidase M14 domain-containing protein n=1 Tax=Anaerobacillus alkalidiazotrophicus TaxID=472963 RepID=A0A1S2MCK6_9BACI|nr:peptidoglycan-binding protein [Anaerobacillus alkalidiazotrophicus]OIJ22340.1 hypothetical protein BKP45_06790 [Anaerobacillus alkalidiazotrophicus]